MLCHRFLRCFMFLRLHALLLANSLLTGSDTEISVPPQNHTLSNNPRILRDILNQETLVRFSMIQKMQVFTMDIIEIKRNNNLLMNKVDALMKEQASATERHSVLEKENEKLRQQVNALQEKSTALDTTDKNWENMIGTHDVEITNLQDIYGNITKDIGELRQSLYGNVRKDIGESKESLSDMNRRLDSWNTSITHFLSDRENVMPEHVAFHAVAYSSTSVDDIIFDHVITNIGGGYDNATGVFIVPTTGLYVLSWTIEAHGRLTEGVLLVNGVQEGLTKAHEVSSHYDTTTSFAVLNLTVNDTVWVRVITGRAEARHTMFSGWKINKTGTYTAFNALLSRDVSGYHIVYDNDTLDTHNAYSTSTGNFVAPRSGLYVFMMSAVNFGKFDYNCWIRFSNGNSQPNVWVDSQSGYYDSSSFMTFGWLNAGEYVYVDADRMRKTSVFAGWQLVDDMSVSKSTYPAFISRLSSRYSGTPVLFNQTFSGYHHGYSVTTGIFTADRDGVYVFLYNIEAYNEIVLTTLRVNGVDKFELRSAGRSTEYDDTSAVSVLQLSSGDQVSVGLKHGTVDDDESLFFGVLLFEM
ncbi:uncharacterized protein LOC125673044 [Ostrea edulis]|uniref:uncharacterized protein LOC125673044 n=1 Tax=Ostrea edulis TaxID=37623 RepID=UPI0024AFA9A8|nr:uncharacterized protein LOC125673044 [Ostrea edulis]